MNAAHCGIWQCGSAAETDTLRTAVGRPAVRREPPRKAQRNNVNANVNVAAWGAVPIAAARALRLACDGVRWYGLPRSGRLPFLRYSIVSSIHASISDRCVSRTVVVVEGIERS